jgi:ABC-type bacteriocin/lantibiotic exporter with double-glycine peptidase domain
MHFNVSCRTIGQHLQQETKFRQGLHRFPISQFINMLLIFKLVIESVFVLSFAVRILQLMTSPLYYTPVYIY